MEGGFFLWGFEVGFGGGYFLDFIVQKIFCKNVGNILQNIIKAPAISQNLHFYAFLFFLLPCKTKTAKTNNLLFTKTKSAKHNDNKDLTNASNQTILSFIKHSCAKITKSKTTASNIFKDINDFSSKHTKSKKLHRYCRNHW